MKRGRKPNPIKPTKPIKPKPILNNNIPIVNFVLIFD